MSYYIMPDCAYFEGEKYDNLRDVEEAIQEAVMGGSIDVDDANDITVSEVKDLTVNIEVTVTVEVC
jgi:hypothetical protein